MNSISVSELKALQESNEDFVIIDIREPYEYDICNISGVSIPMASVLERINEIPKDKKVIIHCKTGKRAAAIIDTLSSKFEYNNLYNLEGGIIAYAEQIDNSLEVY